MTRHEYPNDGLSPGMLGTLKTSTKLMDRSQKSSLSRTRPKTFFTLIVAIQVVALIQLSRRLPDSSVAFHPWKSSSPQLLETSDEHRRQQTSDDTASNLNMRNRRQQHGPLPVLVIGGSDGSGTRSFAHAARTLGVPMKTDLNSNLDVQSGSIFQGEGFAKLVNLVLHNTRSVNYEVSDMNNILRTIALRETRNFKRSIDQWQRSVETHLKAARNRHADFHRSKSVSVGFKAPATMLLLPLIKQVFGPVKFIHVVRDGRDVSLRYV